MIGTLRGYDVFLNVVLDDALEETKEGEKKRLGMVVSAIFRFLFRFLLVGNGGSSGDLRGLRV